MPWPPVDSHDLACTVWLASTPCITHFAARRTPLQSRVGQCFAVCPIFFHTCASPTTHLILRISTPHASCAVLESHVDAALTPLQHAHALPDPSRACNKQGRLMPAGPARVVPLASRRSGLADPPCCGWWLSGAGSSSPHPPPGHGGSSVTCHESHLPGSTQTVSRNSGVWGTCWGADV